MFQIFGVLVLGGFVWLGAMIYTIARAQPSVTSTTTSIYHRMAVLISHDKPGETKLGAHRIQLTVDDQHQYALLSVNHLTPRECMSVAANYEHSTIGGVVRGAYVNSVGGPDTYMLGIARQGLPNSTIRRWCGLYAHKNVVSFRVGGPAPQRFP